MYIHLGQSVVVEESRILGVFDIDNTTTSRITRDFLSRSESDGVVVSISDEIPRSFIVTDDRVYLSLLSSATIGKRCDEGFLG